MNIKKIQELVELMNANDLAEVEVEQEGEKIRVIRKVAGSGVVHHTMQAPQIHAAPAPHAPAASEAAKPKEEVKKLLEIKSPMVGTFYRAPSPDAAPYVKIGDVIHKGDVLCIVEAMKMMNEVKAEIDGKIADILVENAEPVEFGQIMFLVEP